MKQFRNNEMISHNINKSMKMQDYLVIYTGFWFFVPKFEKKTLFFFNWNTMIIIFLSWKVCHYDIIPLCLEDNSCNTSKFMVCLLVGEGPQNWKFFNLCWLHWLWFLIVADALQIMAIFVEYCLKMLAFKNITSMYEI